MKIKKINSCKKSQTEIFGLLIIVILFAAGILFAMTIMSRSSDDEKSIKDKFYSAELSQNFVLTMLKTTVEECREKTLEDLVVDCYYNDNKCEAAHPNSCEYFKEIIRDMFNETLQVWNWNFHFSVDKMVGSRSVQNLDNYSFHNCTPQLDKTYKGKKYTSKSSPGFVAIPLSPGTLNVNLFFCS